MTRLKEMRVSKGMTQDALAKKLGVKCPTVCMLERKGIYDTRTAQKYAVALDCPALFLLEGLSCSLTSSQNSK